MPVVELPAAFAESSIRVALTEARDLLSEGLDLERRGDDHEARKCFSGALMRVDKAIKLSERPRNDNEKGRQVCSYCGDPSIMPNGLCLRHGGE